MKKQYDMGGGRLLVLGVQDVCGSHEDIMDIFQKEGFAFKQIPPEKRRDSLSKRQSQLQSQFDVTAKWVHMNDLFTMMGFESVESMDVFDNEGPDVIHDLNKEVPERFINRYDVILDVGVMEHVCDIRQAAANIIKMLKLTGVLIQLVPLHGWHNMCFYNIQPPFFYEVYGCNGFEDMRTFISWSPKYKEEIKYPKVKLWYQEYRYNDNINFTRPFCHTHIIFIGRKIRRLSSFVVPIQGFYEEYHRKETVPLLEKNRSLSNVWFMRIPGMKRIRNWIYVHLSNTMHGLLENYLLRHFRMDTVKRNRDRFCL